eukprot:4054089-Amphidinium_carterae.1
MLIPTRGKVLCRKNAALAARPPGSSRIGRGSWATTSSSWTSLYPTGYVFRSVLLEDNIKVIP